MAWTTEDVIKDVIKTKNRMLVFYIVINIIYIVLKIYVYPTQESEFEIFNVLILSSLFCIFVVCSTNWQVSEFRKQQKIEEKIFIEFIIWYANWKSKLDSKGKENESQDSK